MLLDMHMCNWLDRLSIIQYNKLLLVQHLFLPK